MTLQVITAGETPTAAKLNAISRQTVIVCTSGTRPSSPDEGMSIYETDTDELLVYHGTQWRRPWNMPWGIVGYAQVTASQGSITTEVDATGLSVTWTAVGNRRYRISAQALLFSSVANDVCQIRITDGSNNIQALAQIVSTSTFGVNAVTSVVQTPTAGSVTRKVRVLRNNGTGNVTMDAGAVYPAFILVEDIGPNGVPA